MFRTILAVFTVLIFSANCFAWAMPKIPGLSSESAPTVSIDDAMSAQDDLVTAYSNGVKYNLEAQSMMASAIGMDVKSAELKNAAAGMGEGNTKGLKVKSKLTEDANAEITKAMKSSKKLSSESKLLLAESFIPLAASVFSYKKTVEKSKPALDEAKKLIKDTPIINILSVKSKLAPTLSIALNAPKDVTRLLAMVSSYAEFAKSKGVKLPKEATDLLGD